MPELEKRIMDVMGPLQLACLATLTRDRKPWCRYVMTVADESMTLRCATHVDARKVQQIAANPEVHVTCGCTDPNGIKPYVQVQARARLATDADERRGFWFSMLANIFEGPDDPGYGVLVMRPYRIELCSPGSFVPEVWRRE